MIRIRKFRQRDAQELSALICNTLRLINIRDYSEETIEKMCIHFSPEKLTKIAKDRVCFVAVNENRIIGTASLKDNIILTVFVDAEIQGKGIGSKLINKVENLALKNGYKKVKVPSSLTSVKFYEKLGYSQVEQTDSDFGKNIIMEKCLKAEEI
ncbi:GNAT family N-acetyltransferase [Candidatus Peregrinibacteria bacterium]|nr:GNAT family N-acetyltransferase [Candidatus Peregrinibacteria bacterium]